MNPELRRNLWLEITFHRLLAVPVILGLIFLAMAVMDEPDGKKMIAWTGLAGFGALTVAWGTRLATNSILDELMEKTWDWQRLSALPPWTMTWGKLFGATAFAWYGGLICLAAFLVTGHVLDDLRPVKVAGIVIALAVLLHAAAIASALHGARYLGSASVRNRRSIDILLLLILFNVVPFMFMPVTNRDATLQWYGRSFGLDDFALVSLVLFAGWATLGAYRAMCQSLAVRTTPWAWLAFAVFVTLYSAGFLAGRPEVPLSTPQVVLLSGLIWALMLTYLMLFTEPAGPVTVNRILSQLAARDVRRLFEELPCWPLTWIGALACALALALIGAHHSKLFAAAWLTPIPLTLLAARDAGLLLFFAAAPKPRRVLGTTLVYILLLNWVIPWLLHSLDLHFLAQLSFPVGAGNGALEIVSALAQACIACGLAYRRTAARLASTARPLEA